MDETIPPDAPLEQAAIGLIITNPLETLPVLGSEPFEDYFADERHTLIYNACVDLIEAGEICTPPALVSLLTSRNQLFDGAPELIKHFWIENATAIPGSAALFVREYANKLRALYLRRVKLNGARRLVRCIAENDIEEESRALKEIADANEGRTGDGLPEIEDAATIEGQHLAEPSELVYGLFHIGSKLVLGGSSKSFKTWTLIDLALAVAFGEPFWSMKTAKGRVLFLNFEVQSVFFWKRVKAVAHAKNIKLQPGQLEVMNLRGHAADFRELLPKIERKIRRGRYSLIIFDPLYKLLGNSDENSAGDIAKMMNAIERLCRETGAAVAFGSHFAKGNASAKESIDRISGSGVFARDPDSILTLTKHEEDECFAVEATLRNFKPLEPFVVRWGYPLMRRDDELDPTKLKQAKGRPAKFTVQDILVTHPNVIGMEGGVSFSAWRDESKKRGISGSTFKRLLEFGLENDVVRKSLFDHTYWLKTAPDDCAKNPYAPDHEAEYEREMEYHERKANRNE